ncbi:MAG TPA: hypothetical protein VFO83_08705, partial [Aggregicoccus sp.]|nr:hypothetical protein [Aggregicoccus sp.]
MRVVPLLLAVFVVTSRLALAQQQQQQQPPAAAAELRVLEPGAGFRVRMPGAPKLQPIQQTMEDGSELSGAAWASQVGPHVYRVRYLDFPPPPEGTAVDWLGNVQEWLLEEVDARPGKVERATLQGHPGRHLTFASENAQGSMRFYVVGLRVYQLLLIYPHGMAGPANTQAYFDSLELTEPVAAATTKAAPTPVVLAPGQSLQAEIAPGDMQGDLGRPVDQYFIRGKRGQRVTLEVRGDSMAMFVQVKAPAKGPELSEASERAGAALLFTRTLPADGDYLVTVSSNEGVRKFGTYRIALREERGRWTPPRTEPRVEELTLGQEVEGTLRHDDAIDENWDTFRRYRYRGAAGQRVLFTVRSEDLPRSEEPFSQQNLRLLQARTGKDAHRTIPLGESSRTVLQVVSEPDEGEDGDLFVDVVGVSWTPVREEASFRLSVVPVQEGTLAEAASTPVSAGHIAEPGYL